MTANVLFGKLSDSQQQMLRFVENPRSAYSRKNTELSRACLRESAGMANDIFHLGRYEEMDAMWRENRPIYTGDPATVTPENVAGSKRIIDELEELTAGLGEEGKADPRYKMLELALASRLGRNSLSTGTNGNQDQLRTEHAQAVKKLLAEAPHYTPSDFIVREVGESTQRDMNLAEKVVLFPVNLVLGVMAWRAMGKASGKW